MTEQDFNELTREDAKGQSGPSPPKGPRALRNISRELTEEDLANPSPAVQKLLLNEIDRLEVVNEEHKHYMELFHEADKEVAVLKQKADKEVAVLKQQSRTALALDTIAFGGCLTVGALLLGMAPGLWSHQPFGWIVVVVGGVTLGIGIAAKVVSAIGGKAS